MHELIRLLTEYGADEPTIALAQRWIDSQPDAEGNTPEGVEALTDVELDELLNSLSALADDAEASTALLREARVVAQSAQAEVDRREEAAAADEAENQRERALLRGEDPDAAAEGDGEGDGDGDGDEGGDGGGDGTGDGDGGEGAEGAADRELVGAGASAQQPPAPARPAPAARRTLSARRRTSQEPAPEAGPARSEIIFDDAIPRRLQDGAGGLAAIDRALLARADQFGRSRPRGGREEIPVATIRATLPDERMLVDSAGSALSAAAAGARIEAALRQGIARYRGANPAERAALTAAGGVCALPQPIWNVEVMGDDRRPIRDTALTSFGAPRMRILQLAPPTLPDLSGAISQWTIADDVAALANDGGPDDVVKPCLRIECGDERDAEMYAIPVCLTWGNFMGRTNGELVDAWTELSMVAQARFAEVLLLQQMRSLSKITDHQTTTLSATRDILEQLDRAAVGFRSRHRLSRDFPFRVILPEVALAIFRSDIARSLPGGSFVENLAVADATIQRFFAERSLNVTWTPDDAIMGPQLDGEPLVEYPTQVDWLLYPEGTFIHLTTPDLVIGLVRDSALNRVNDVQTFAETFEGVHLQGAESIGGSINLCPSGAVSGTVDPGPLCEAYTAP